MDFDEIAQRRFSLLMLAGFLLLVAFIGNFFLTMSSPGYWHSGEIGSYLTHGFFAVDKGFFVEIPYWHYGYGLVSFQFYQPLFYILNTGLFHLSSLFKLDSIYWTYFAALLLSYVFAFALTWKVSKKGSLVYLLTMGNFFSLGMLVILGIIPKIFAFNLCFPAIVYLLDRRKSLEMTSREILAFSLLMAAVFASHIFVFAFFALLYLSVLSQNRKAWLKGLVPLALVPVLTMPYLMHALPHLLGTVSSTPIAPNVLGMAFNLYVAVFVLFILLFAVVREQCLLPFAALAAVFALNLNTVIPVFSNLTANFSVLFFLALIFYYLANHDFSKYTRFFASRSGWPNRQNALIAMAFALLVLNFFYFAPRIENANLFNNPDYGPLLQYGALESVFFFADLAENGDNYQYIYLSYQTFKFHNYSLNAWFPLGKSHLKFEKDRQKIVTALKENDCQLLESMAEKLGLKTIVVKNLPKGFSCSIPIEADIGKFRILKP